MFSVLFVVASEPTVDMRELLDREPFFAAYRRTAFGADYYKITPKAGVNGSMEARNAALNTRSVCIETEKSIALRAGFDGAVARCGSSLSEPRLNSGQLL